jgi:hypothetical protein
MARAERLHRRLFGGEAPRQVRDGIPSPRTIGNLTVGEDAAQEPLPIAVEYLGEARNVRRVEAETQDRHD